MRYRPWSSRTSVSMIVAALLLTAPRIVYAQEPLAAQPKESACPMCETHMKKKMAHAPEGHERHQMHQQMETMHQEMTKALQEQLTALQDHAKAMETISDQNQLIIEMKKHQQMSDTLLGTMIEQRQKMHDMRHDHHQHRHGARAHERKAPESTTTPERLE